MSQINRIPLGYLNMLQAQTGGKTPFDTFDQVMPTIDMNEFYLAQGLAVEQTNFTPVGNGDNVSLTVPNNEVWLLRAVGANITSIAIGDAAQYLISIRTLPKSGNNSIVVAASEQLVATAVTEQLAFVQQINAPFFLQGGQELLLTTQQLVNPRNTFLSALVQEFTS